MTDTRAPSPLAKRTPPSTGELTCLLCTRPIAPGEPVWRALTRYRGLQRWQRRTGVRCAQCAASARPGDYPDQPAPCAGCNRPVYNRHSAIWRLHAYCSRSCELTMWAAHQRAKRAEARRKTHVCTCGHEFVSTRRDARFCSAGCRQRAYRERGDGKPIAAPSNESTSCNAEAFA